MTEAKHEAATAMAQTLEAREDALRWQRALGTPGVTMSSTLPATSLPATSLPAAAALHWSPTSSSRSPP